MRLVCWIWYTHSWYNPYLPSKVRVNDVTPGSYSSSPVIIVKVEPLCKGFDNSRKQNVHLISPFNQNRLLNEEEDKKSQKLTFSSYRILHNFPNSFKHIFLFDFWTLFRIMQKQGQGNVIFLQNWDESGASWHVGFFSGLHSISSMEELYMK